MPTPHSHKHFQAAQAYAVAKTWHKGCLFSRTSKTTNNQTDEKEHRLALK
jgi:hypothetical protein